MSEYGVLMCYFLFLLIFSFCFASGAPDNIKIWKFPDGNFLQNFSGHQAIVNTVAVNSDNVLVSGGEFKCCLWAYQEVVGCENHTTVP